MLPPFHQIIYKIPSLSPKAWYHKFGEDENNENNLKEADFGEAYVVEELVDHLLELFGAGVLREVHGRSQRSPLRVSQLGHDVVVQFSLFFAFFDLHRRH